MGFFDRNRKELEARGLDPTRLPKGQYLTERFPVLHVGDVPTYAPGPVWARVKNAIGIRCTCSNSDTRRS